jgi:hypothetical protein
MVSALTPTSNGTGPARPRVWSGRGLSHRQLDARQKGCVAAEVRAGRVAIELSLKQLAAILGVSMTYIVVAEKLSPEKRQAIIEGDDVTSFAPLLNPPLLALPAPHPKMPRHFTPMVDDAELIDFVRVIGIPRVLEAAVAVEAAE